jgi:3-phenylpropionate/trans-cinnamate dioxygenase ferredoxin reductase subunit
VVVGIGVKPRIELAAAAGLAVDDGVVVDAHLRTSHPDVFAAGDVASAFHPLLGARVRVEHWANALHQGPAAARNMLDIPTPYERIPYFFSDQFDLGMEYAGHASTWDRVVFRGDPADRKFLAFWIADGVLVAGMHANLWDEAHAIQRLVRERACVDPALLADPSTPLDALAGASDSALV